MNSNRETLYKSRFSNDIDEIIDFISEQSVQNASKFILGIQPTIEKITKHPESNPIVKQIPTKRNWYRYRIFKKTV